MNVVGPVSKYAEPPGFSVTTLDPETTCVWTKLSGMVATVTCWE